MLICTNDPSDGLTDPPITDFQTFDFSNFVTRIVRFSSPLLIHLVTLKVTLFSLFLFFLDKDMF